jgi:hypothetical protein
VKRFHLRRITDISGVSGTGLVAEGVEFSDGTVAMRWLTRVRSTCLFASMDDVQKIHSHAGATVVEWVE